MMNRRLLGGIDYLLKWGARVRARGEKKDTYFSTPLSPYSSPSKL